MVHIIQRRKGFTLAELVIYMGILSLLLVIFVDMFAILINRQLETESNSSIQQDTSYLFSRLNYDFGKAKNIISPVVLGSTVSSLELQIGSTPYSYYLFDGNLVSSQSGIIVQLNSSETSISNLTFRRLGMGDKNDVIQVMCDIVSKVKKQSGNEIYHFSTTFGIREK